MLSGLESVAEIIGTNLRKHRAKKTSVSSGYQRVIGLMTRNHRNVILQIVMRKAGIIWNVKEDAG
jgi:hypothetical protein